MTMLTPKQLSAIDAYIEHEALLPIAQAAALHGLMDPSVEMRIVDGQVIVRPSPGQFLDATKGEIQTISFTEKERGQIIPLFFISFFGPNPISNNAEFCLN